MRTIRLSVKEFINGILDETQNAEAAEVLSNRSYDVFDNNANVLRELLNITYVEPPVYDSLEKTRTCMVWGGKINKATLLRSGMLEIEFKGVFVLCFKNNKFSLFRHVFKPYRTKCNDLISQGRPVTVADYAEGFNIGGGIKRYGIAFHSISRDVVRDFVDCCASACFPEASVRLFKEVVKEGCNGFATINSILKPSYRTKYDIISKGGNIRNLPRSLNKYNINVGYLIREAKHLLSDDSMAKLYGKKNEESLLDCFMANGKLFRRYDCMKKYLVVVLALYLFPNIDLNVVLKYFAVCKANGFYPDLTISRERTMLEKLEPYFEKTPQNSLNVAEPYRRLEKMLDYKYHLIQTKEELRFEGIMQRNCVYTYEDDIEAGYCGIFTYTENGNRYTIEVLFYNGFYSCNQFLGFANSFSDECFRLRKVLSFELDDVNVRIAS